MKVKFQVNTMTGKEAELQRELHDVEQKSTQLKEEYSKEKTRLTEDLEVVMEELKNTKVSFPWQSPLALLTGDAYSSVVFVRSLQCIPVCFNFWNPSWYVEVCSDANHVIPP